MGILDYCWDITDKIVDFKRDLSYGNRIGVVKPNCSTLEVLSREPLVSDYQQPVFTEETISAMKRCAPFIQLRAAPHEVHTYNFREDDCSYDWRIGSRMKPKKAAQPEGVYSTSAPHDYFPHD